jgi:hypothetical protein
MLLYMIDLTGENISKCFHLWGSEKLGARLTEGGWSEPRHTHWHNTDVLCLHHTHIKWGAQLAEGGWLVPVHNTNT